MRKMCLKMVAFPINLHQKEVSLFSKHFEEKIKFTAYDSSTLTILLETSVFIEKLFQTSYFEVLQKVNNLMTRWDYDTIFQRVFCVTLVAIAVTFTVILTNVFVDIDGLLSRKDKVNSFADSEPVFENEKQAKASPTDASNELPSPPYYKAYKQEKNYEDINNYRSKRSLESQNFLFHIRNPKMKRILTSRLATLLEELDEEESNNEPKNKIPEIGDISKALPDKEKEIEVLLDENEKSPKTSKPKHDSSNTDEDLLHLAIHNILLQGIIGHMDLNDVYRKVHVLINNFKKTNVVDENLKPHHVRTKVSPAKIINEVEEGYKNLENEGIFESKIRSQNANVIENKAFAEERKFFEEMAECEKLESDVKKITDMKSNEKSRSTEKPQLLNVLIKTIIDITSLHKNKTNKEHMDSKERVKGIVQLIYNGKSVKFSKMDENGLVNRRFNDHMLANNPDIHQKKLDQPSITNTEFNDAIEILQEKRQEKTNAFLNNFLSEYLVKDPQKFSDLMEIVDSRQNYKAKRYKRQIKIRYQDVNTEKKKKKVNKLSLAKTNDDELYVEIETHFNSKGMKGEKKKKLIRNLIDKIQKAIKSDVDLTKDNKKRKHKRYHIKKRIQHPLVKNRTLFINKVMIPIDKIAERHSDPITKTVATEQEHIAHTLTDKSGENWKKMYYGPGFLTVAKSVNSAEMGEVDIDYNKMVPSLDVVTPRQQLPLNADISEETANANSFFNMGDMKFVIKDIDGTGLSIGFNQYTDEPPDPETMKVFSGIENILSNYQQTGDQTKNYDQRDHNSLGPIPVENEKHFLTKRDINSSENNEHIVIRRSIKELNDKDYHSNEYKIIFNGNFLPYDNYEQIIEDKNKRIAIKLNKENDLYPFIGKSDAAYFKQNLKLKDLPALMDDNIMYKKLKPVEILNLASILNRKKRNVKNKSVINRKIKLNKYINRRSSKFSPKKLILSKKRNKRQIDKIRIIATDSLNREGDGRDSEENIFFVSNENLFTDRAVVRDVERFTDAVNEVALRKKKTEDDYHNTIPYVYDDPVTVLPYTAQIRMAPLMSRYPHIIMEEITTSNEQYNPMVKNMEMNPMKIRKPSDLVNQLLEQKTESKASVNMPGANFDQTLDDVDSYLPNQNYKLTLKILPRNVSHLNTGFKEIHTSINKSFNRNGKIYSSLFNVSEISKIENINTTLSPNITPKTTLILSKPNLTKRFKEQQVKMDLLLKEHRKKIDEQLEHLKQERNRIETLGVSDILVNNKTLEANEKISLADVNLNKLIDLLKYQAHKDTTMQPPSTTVTPDLEKVKMLSTIPRNDNITNEILHQIRRNTELLERFLTKLSEEKKPVIKGIEENEEVKPITRTDKMWTHFYNQYNETHSPIPFVYAFEHPYSVKRKSENVPVASVVYHGLIHTLKGIKNNPRNNLEILNQTKYFIDGVENGFKEANVKEMAKIDVINAQNCSSIKI